MKVIQFNKFYKHFGIFSVILILISLLFLFFKGLNYGVDFKGGTLIELRLESSDHSVSKVREVFKKSNLFNLTIIAPAVSSPCETTKAGIPIKFSLFI